MWYVRTFYAKRKDFKILKIKILNEELQEEKNETI